MTATTQHTPNRQQNLGLNYSYFVDYVQSFPDYDRMRVLDYGCGSGETVAMLRRVGVDAVGCDTLYAGNGHTSAQTAALAERQREGIVFAVPEAGPLPFAPHSFDLILANQVFEHVVDLDATLDRLDAVLAPGGVMCFHFPSDEVIREGHMGIPFAHWFRKGAGRGTLRWYWTVALRALGLGYHKRAGQSVAAWTDEWLDWLDRYTIYRPRRVLYAAFGARYAIRTVEMRYVRFRARRYPWLAALLRHDALAPLSVWLFRRMGFYCFELRPKALS